MKNTKRWLRDTEDTGRQSQVIKLYKVGVYKTGCMNEPANHKIGQTSTIPDSISQTYALCDIVTPETVYPTISKFTFY